jgi:hypothetical protein
MRQFPRFLLLAGAVALSACRETTDPTVEAPAVAAAIAHRSFYVSPSGTAGGTGSATAPWDLRTALRGTSAVQPGDTIWLRSGTYTGNFASALRGTATAPIIVRGLPGQRATIQGTLSVSGAYAWFWGFEVANTSTSTQDVMGVNSHAPGSRFINLVVHDHSGNGMGIWSEAPDAEVYGSIVYNNGFRGSSAGRVAHGIYAQNSTGTKRLADNVVYQTFGYGFHLYTEASALKNFTLDGNVAFNNGLVEGNDVMVGGGTPVQRLTFTGNMTYHSPELSGGGVWLGRSGTTNSDGVVRGNYLVYGDPTLRLFDWSTLTVASNSVVAGKGLLDEQGPWSGFQWSGNQWYGTPTRQEILWGATGLTYSTWKQATRLGGSDSYSSGSPTTTKVFVRPNRYETGRANVIVYNWSRQSSVAVNLGSVLTVGARYEIRNALAPYGAPVASGTYGGGTVKIPLAATTPPKPIGGWVTRAPASSNAFGVFIVTRTR